MPFSFRHRSRIGWALASVLAFGVALTPRPLQAGEPAGSPPEMLADAELHDIHFTDLDRGWAVGDRGVIWQTESGGRRWTLVDSPTTARLQSVHFADTEHGWIAGGWIHPGSRRSSAVILRTENGGRKWIRIEVPTLPALRKIHFVDARQGWAIGDASPLYSVGIYWTRDGGYTWESHSSAQPLTVQAGTFLGPGRALVIATDGSSWMYSNGSLQPSAGPGGVGHRPRQVVCAETRGWLVGDGGSILHSDTGGRKWQIPPGKLPDGFERKFDWRTVAMRGEKCWIAGSPGSVVLSSADHGRSWRAFRTGQTIPIRQLYFLNEQHGWALGALGRILATRDGGQTWRVQQSGGERLALWSVHAADTSLPLEWLAQSAAEEGQLTAAALLETSSAHSLIDTRDEERLREACSAVGVSAFERLQGRSRGAQAQAEGGTGAGAGGAASPAASPLPDFNWEEELVKQLRIWRPDVVLTDPLPTQSSEGPSASVGQSMLRAVQRAGDPAAYPDQIVLLGLQPWTVRKLWGVVPPEAASATLETGRLSMQLGCSLADYVLPARVLAVKGMPAGPSSVGCRLLWSQATHELAVRGIFGGIPLSAPGEARRSARSLPPTRVAGLARTAQQLKLLQDMTAQPRTADADLTGLVLQIEQVLQGQESDAVGRLLFRLSQQLVASGNYAGAARCLGMLIDRCPEHPLTDATLLWLWSYHSSAEMQRAFGPNEVVRLPGTGAELAVRGSAVQPAAHVEPIAAAEGAWTAAPGDARAAALAERIRQTRPALYADPRIQFPLVALHRRMGNDSESGRLLNVLAAAPLGPAWRHIARREQQLSERKEPTPFRPQDPLLLAAHRSVKPVLDGDLGDECWRGVTPLTFPGTVSDPATELRWACDADYVFLAIRGTRRLPRIEDLPDRRPRDARLDQRDRVQIDLDLDRDHHAHYRLTVDEYGWTHDACGADARWDPRWFVAAAGDDSEWRLELAIPRAELESRMVEGDVAWGIRVRRIVPGQGTHSWPATGVQSSHEPWDAGDHFGWLILAAR